MKVQICSDLHVRNSNHRLHDYIEFTEADVLIIAGDLCPVSTGRAGIMLQEAADNYKHVIYVAGNHEFYGSDLNAIYNLKWANRYDDRIHILENDSVTIDHVKFFGGTMWAEVDLAEYVPVSTCLNDFRLIKDFHVATSDRLYRKFVQEFDYSADVVISHFAPSKRSIAPIYENSNINSYFANNFLDKVAISAKLWIHGHTHSNLDYAIDNTRVICNPGGYPGENKGFDRSLIIGV